MLSKFISLLLVAFILGVGFMAGYQVGGKKINFIVRADAPVAHITQELNIGTVAGTESAILHVDPSPSPGVTPEDVRVNSRNEYDGKSILRAANQYRKAHSLSAFETDDKLCQFARERLGQIEAKGAIDNHEGFKAKIDNYFTKYNFRRLAENLAQGYSGPSEVINGWDKSTGHRSLLLSGDLTHACSAAQNGLVVLLAGRY